MEVNSGQQEVTQQTTSGVSNEPPPTPEITSPSSLPKKQQKRNFLPKALAIGATVLLGLILSGVLWYQDQLYFFFPQYYIAAPTLLSILLGLLIASPTTLWPNLTVKRLMFTIVLFSYILSGVFWSLIHLQDLNLPEYSVVLPLLTALLLTLISIGYTLRSSRWTGFGDYAPPQKDYQRSKTLWDWLQLLIIPVILAAGALWFNAHQDYLNQQTMMDQRQEAALQDYLGKISDLLLKNELSDPKTQPQARQLARVWTLTALRQLDSNRKGILLRFLYDANLIGKYTPPTTKGGKPTIINPIIDLTDADFYGVTLSAENINNTVSLSGAVLSGAFLLDASLVGVDLSYADLSNANLAYANLLAADLTGAKLNGTDFDNATLTSAKGFNSSGVKSLSGATMPDGTKHP